MNARLARTLTIVGLAAAVAATAAVAAVATTPRDEMTSHMGGRLPAHMDQLTGDQWADMGRFMNDGDHTAMHDWMDEEGLDVDRMHGDPVHDGTDMRGMHGGLSGSGRQRDR